MRSWQRGQLGCLIWNDKKPVLFLSTHRRVDGLTTIPSVRGGEATKRPTVAVDYNLNKGHVDQVDQLRSYYVVERRGRRTWPALAWWLLDLCIINAYKLWSLDHSAQPGVLRFREQLLAQIAAAYPSPLTHVQPTVPAVAHRRYIGHWPEFHGRSHDCVHCSSRRQQRRTKYMCAVCAVYLGAAPCFGAYHERLDIDYPTL